MGVACFLGHEPHARHSVNVEEASVLPRRHSPPGNTLRCARQGSSAIPSPLLGNGEGLGFNPPSDLVCAYAVLGRQK